MLNYHVHYMNKYPGCRVQSSDSSFDVYSQEGEHLVALRKNGANQWQDESEKFGCVEKHCLAPIPKDARVHKVVDGKIGHDELHEERKERREMFRSDSGKVLSIDELKKSGHKFDDQGRHVEAPQEKK